MVCNISAPIRRGDFCYFRSDSTEIVCSVILNLQYIFQQSWLVNQHRLGHLLNSTIPKGMVVRLSANALFSTTVSKLIVVYTVSCRLRSRLRFTALYPSIQYSKKNYYCHTLFHSVRDLSCTLVSILHD